MKTLWLIFVCLTALDCRVLGGAMEIGELKLSTTAEAGLPNLARSAAGTIYCVFAVKPRQTWDEIDITSTRDAGRSWSDPVKVMECPENGYIADPNILVSDRGVTVFATFVPQHAQRRIATSRFLASTSRDGKLDWSAPEQIPAPHKYIAGKVHVPVWLDQKTVVMGYAWDVPADEGRPVSREIEMFNRAGVLISSDAGQSWSSGGDINVDVHPMGADEPALVKLKNGDLFAIVRTGTEHPYESRSSDGGKSWSAAKPTSFWGYNSPSALLRLSDGSILRVWDNSPKDRVPLVASISTDECATWSTPRTIIDAPAVQRACYPSIAQANDGSILVSWWQTKDGRSSVGWARFDRQWVTEP